MVLAYKFEYISTNMMLENFLKVICSDFKIANSIKRDDSITSLFVKESEKRLHEFADYIALYLPLSIFLKSMSVEVVDEMGQKNFRLEKCTVALPFTKKAFMLSEDSKSSSFKNPFTPNEIGKICENSNTSLMLYSNNNILIANNSISYEKLYKRAANILATNEPVTIKTNSGNFTFSKVSKLKLKNETDFEIIPTDLSNAQKMVILNEDEIRNLASLEKPVIRARINSIYASKDIILQKSVKVRLPNTLLLQFICSELHKIGVDFIIKTKLVKECEYIIDHDTKTPKIDDLEICTLENNEVLILKGSQNIPKQFKKGLMKLKDPAIRQYVSVLKERNLFDFKTSCFYFSKINSDKILFNDDKQEMLEFVKFDKFSSIEEIFQKIKEDGDSGEKLVNNYKQTFPTLYKQALNVKIPKNLAENLYNLFAFSSIILGFSDNFENAADVLIENAESFGGQKGPRIEFSQKENRKIKSDFSAIKMIRSAMSFKLAGAEEQTLCFGFFDSFSYFVSDMADAHKETLGSSKIVLAGSLFTSKRLTEITCKNLLASHKIYFNRELPIDNI